MRILYFSRDYTTHDRRFLERLGASGHETWFLRLDDDGSGYEKRLIPPGVRPIEWKGAGGRGEPQDLLRLMPRYEEVLRRVSPDVIQAGPIQSCGFMTAMAGVRPFIAMSWGSDILVDADRDEMSRWMTRFTLARSDLLVCDCDAVRKKAVSFAPYREDQFVQFPWGVDLKEFAPGRAEDKWRRRPDWQDAFIILSTRSWERIYGIDILLEAFRLAYQRHPNLRLVLLGNGSLAPDIRNFIRTHHLESIVLEGGRIPEEEMAASFHSADLYMSSSLSDGSSISLLQAMACALPVLVSDTPGNREWVLAGENGWLAEPGSAASFAEAILKAAALPSAMRTHMGSRNRSVAEARADWNRNVEILLKAYDRLEAKRDG